MKTLLLDNSGTLQIVLDKLSMGGIGAFFVLMFMIMLLLVYIIKTVCTVSGNAPKMLVIGVSAVVSVLFVSMAFYAFIRGDGGGRQLHDKPNGAASGSYYKATTKPVLFASLNLFAFQCTKRDIFHKLSFNGSKPFYILLNDGAADTDNNQLALLSIAGDGKSITLRVGLGSPFTATLNTPVMVNGGPCKYQLTFKEVTTADEKVILKRQFAHYTLTPVP